MSIYIFEQGYEAFDSFGLGQLFPITCVVREEQAGNYDLELVHPMDEAGRYHLLKNGRVLKVPAPAVTTPAIRTEGVGSREVWKTTASARVYSQPRTTLGSQVTVPVSPPPETASLKSQFVKIQGDGGSTTAWKPNGNRVLVRLGAGENVTILATHNASWKKIVTAGGVTGFIQTSLINLDHIVPGVPGDEIQTRKVRDQLFRIYKTEKDTDSLEVRCWARHIFYDLLGVALLESKVEDATVSQGLAAIQAAGSQTDHGFSFYTNISDTITGEWTHKGMVEGLLDPDEGLASLANARIVRDNFDVYFLKRAGSVKAVISYGQNLMGVQLEIDDDGVVNRIIPVGSDKDGGKLLLSPPHVDSSRNNEATLLRAKVIEYSEAKESTDKDKPMTRQEALDKLLELAEADFESGIDLPDITVKVDFLQLGDTEEYQQYRDLDRLYLGDLVRVQDSLHGLDLEAEVTGYEYDCISQRYTDMTVGLTDAQRTIGSVSSYMLPTGGVSGHKLVPGSVPGNRIEHMSVGSMQIGLAAIEYAHMNQAVVSLLMAESIEAVKGEFQRLVAGQITTDELWANLAEIIRLQVQNADMDWANIGHLTAAVADIVSLEARNAVVDWAKIRDLVTDTAIITQGVGERLFIARLAVTEANIVSLTVGELIVKGEDGKFYALVPDGQGGVTTVEKLVQGQNIEDRTIGGGKLIQQSITTQELNVENIFADSQVVRQLMAAHIDVDTLFGREATITALNAVNITGNQYLQIALAGKASISLMEQSISLMAGNLGRAPGADLLAGTTWTDGYLDASGAVVMNSQHHHSDYIPVLPGEVYAVMSAAPLGMAPATVFYDSAKAFVGALTGDARGVFTVPAGVVFVRHTKDKSDAGRVEKVDGNAGADILRGVGLHSGYLDAVGAVVANAGWRHTNYIPVIRGEAYTLKGHSVPGTAPATVFYTPGKVFISALTGGSRMDFVAPETAGFMRHSIAGVDLATGQIEKRAQAATLKTAGITIGPGTMDLEASVAYNQRAGSGANEIGVSNSRVDGLWMWGGGSPEAAKIRMWMDGAARFDQIMLGNSGVNQFTQMYPYAAADNADAANPMAFKIFVPAECGGVQSLKLSFQLEFFRSYGTGAASGGSGTQTSQGVSSGTISSFSTSIEAAQGGGHVHTVPARALSTITHTHPVYIPGHEHGLIHGIYRGTVATSCQVIVDGVNIGSFSSLTAHEVVQHLSKASGKVTRDAWHMIQIIPNALTRIVAQAFLVATMATASNAIY